MLEYRLHARPLGFTMVELIVVMVVMGIIGAIGMSRFMDRKSLDARTYADQVKSVLRYSQKLAVAQRREIFIVSSKDRIAACFNGVACNAGDLVPAPGGSNSKSSATKTHCGNDRWLCEGRPSTVTATSFGAFSFQMSGSITGGTQSIQITGDGAQTITVEAGTGYVH